MTLSLDAISLKYEILWINFKKLEDNRDYILV